MKHIRLQMDIIRNLNKQWPETYFYEFTDNALYLTDNHVIRVIDARNVFISQDYLEEHKNAFAKDVSKLIQEQEGVVEGTADGIVKESFMRSFMHIAGEEGAEAWINKDFLKYFENPTFKIKDLKSPVWVYESGKLVGLIMPVNVPMKADAEWQRITSWMPQEV